MDSGQTGGLTMIVKEVLKLKIKSRRRYALFITLAAIVICGFTIYDMLNHPND